jgi:hypothetical protein
MTRRREAARQAGHALTTPCRVRTVNNALPTSA